MEHIYYVYLLPAIWLHKGLIAPCHCAHCPLYHHVDVRNITCVRQRGKQNKCTEVTRVFFCITKKYLYVNIFMRLVRSLPCMYIFLSFVYCLHRGFIERMPLNILLTLLSWKRMGYHMYTTMRH